MVQNLARKISKGAMGMVNSVKLLVLMIGAYFYVLKPHDSICEQIKAAKLRKPFD